MRMNEILLESNDQFLAKWHSRIFKTEPSAEIIARYSYYKPLAEKYFEKALKKIYAVNTVKLGVLHDYGVKFEAGLRFYDGGRRHSGIIHLYRSVQVLSISRLFEEQNAVVLDLDYNYDLPAVLRQVFGAGLGDHK